MKKAYFILFFLCYSQLCLSQSKYFEKKIAFGSDWNGATSIQPQDDFSLKISGLTIKSNANGENPWFTYIIDSDLEGQTSNIKEFNYINENNISFSWIMQDIANISVDKIAITGWLEGFDLETNDWIIFGFLMFTNETNDSIGFYQYNGISTSFHGIAKSLNESSVVLAGGNFTEENQSLPYLIKVNEQGETLWEQTYEIDNGRSSWLRHVVASNDGGYFATGVHNWSSVDSDIIDLLILKLDSLGNETDRRILDFGYSEGASEILIDQDGSLVLGVTIGYSSGDPEAFILKMSPDLEEVLWSIKVLDAASPRGLLQIEDGSFIVTGSHKFESGLVDVAIAKVAADGSEMLWRRYYGGNSSDYSYDICESPDGGFAVVGQTVRPELDTTYVYYIKTNCMGLITEPEATFNHYNTENPLNIQFLNQSNYVYPDSIDGGHFVWDFGDGTVATDLLLHPNHTYEEEGFYTVQLSAIVCNDTSIYSQTVSTYPVGLEDNLTANSNSKSSLTVVPNPITTTSTIHYEIAYDLTSNSNLESTLLRLYNLQGQLLKTYPINSYSGSIELNAANLSQGLYFVQLEQNNTIIQQQKIEILR